MSGFLRLFSFADLHEPLPDSLIYIYPEPLARLPYLFSCLIMESSFVGCVM